MHLSEGVLSAPVLAGGAAVAFCATGLALRRLLWDQIMTVGVLSAAFFTASLIHIPLPPSSVHLILNGLMGAVLGTAAIPAITVALFLQALLFQFGGLAVLGVNICVMALPTLVCDYVFRPMLMRPEKRALAAFACGSLTPLMSACLFALVLSLNGIDFQTLALAVLLAHIPVCLVEGAVTVAAVKVLFKTSPEIFSSLRNVRDGR